MESLLLSVRSRYKLQCVQTEMKNNPVEHPIHYNRGSIEAINAIRSALGKDGFIRYCIGNALKYLWRCFYKGKIVEDLKKSVWYIERAIKELESERSTRGQNH